MFLNSKTKLTAPSKQPSPAQEQLGLMMKYKTLGKKPYQPKTSLTNQDYGTHLVNTNSELHPRNMCHQKQRPQI